MMTSSTIPILLLLNVYTVCSVLYGDNVYPLVLNPIYQERSAFGVNQKKYQSLSVDRISDCARLCTKRRKWNTSCLSFGYNRRTKICDFYKRRNSGKITNPNLRIFMLPYKGTFFTVYVNKGRVYSVNFVGKFLNYNDARAYCISQGGKLLEFDTTDKYRVFRTIQPWSSQIKIWIGANDKEIEGQWVTESEGTPIDPNIWRWMAKSPDGGTGQNCAVLHVWYIMMGDLKCSSKQQFLCERPV